MVQGRCCGELGSSSKSSFPASCFSSCAPQAVSHSRGEVVQCRYNRCRYAKAHSEGVPFP